MKNIAIALIVMIPFVSISALPVRSVEPGRLAIADIYDKLTPAHIKPSYEVFYHGLAGYYEAENRNLLKNKKYITLIDFTLSSNERRLWVIDLENNAIVFNTLVAHGRNTGDEFAANFSNTPNTNMSSIGFYVTGSTYYGKHGLSLYLDGLEKGVNDNARRRTIVMHSASYATQTFINKVGRLGRSFGCPAIPPAKHKEIIETIKNRSCFFIYYNDADYLGQSGYL